MNSFFLRIIVASLLTTLLGSTALLAEHASISKSKIKRTVISNVGFATPESVEYNAAEDVYLVTNINGNSLAVDGNGFISKIDPEGQVVELKWIDGTKKGVSLNAPKGAVIQDDILYVTDIDQVQIFKLPSGKQIASVTIKGSTFLNGITAGGNGFVYVTDSGFKAGKAGFELSGTDAVYKVWANGSYELIFKDQNMGGPNGVLAMGNEIMVVTFGSGEVFRIDEKGQRHSMPKPPKGQLDGFLMLDDGRLLISSWGESAIYILHKDKTYSILADSLDAPADLGFDTKRNRVLVPLFNQNQVVFLSL